MSKYSIRFGLNLMMNEYSIRTMLNDIDIDPPSKLSIKYPRRPEFY
jgi:hypothetical protein